MSAEFDQLVERYGGWRKDTWKLAAKTVHEQGGFCLVETGCYRGTESDGCSTVLLAQLSKDRGGWLDSYELDPKNIETAKAKLSEHGLLQQVAFHEGDSVTALAARGDPVHFAYLDSYDCGLGPDYSPCQEHQLAELEAVLPLMSRRSCILLDDHVANTGGKTKLSMQRLDRLEWQQAACAYQVLYVTENAYRFVPHTFAVLTGHLPNYAAMSARSLYRNRGKYCLRHGYDLRFCRKAAPEYDDPATHAGGWTWSRLKMLLHMVETNAYQWIWCVGCDTLVTNQTIRLEDIAAESQTTEASQRPFPSYPPLIDPAPPPVIRWTAPENYPVAGAKHLIFSGEAVAPIQADSFLVKCTAQTADFIQELLSTYPQYKYHGWVENQTMIDLLQKFAPIIHIVPQHRLNSFDYATFHHVGEIYKLGKDCYGNRGQWEPGDFLIHWPGQSYEQRMALLDKYEPQVIQ